MVKAPDKQGVLTPVTSLPLIKRVYDIRDDRGTTFCHIRYPSPKERIIDSGEPYSGRNAYLVLTGEIKEFITVVDDVGRKYRIKSKSFKPGSIVFPQALEIKLASEDSLASYWVGDHKTSILELHHDLVVLLGYSAEMISFMAQSEHERTNDDEIRTRMIHAFFSRQHGILEAKLRTIEVELREKVQALQTAENQIRTLEADQLRLRKNNSQLTASFQDLEQQLKTLAGLPPESTGDFFSEAELAAIIPNDVIPERPIPIEDASSDLLEEAEDLQEADADEGNPQESTKNGVAPPSVYPRRCDSDAVTLAPPPTDESGAVSRDEHRPTLTYQEVAPFAGLSSEEPPPLSEHCDSKAPTRTNVQSLQIPQQTGVVGFQSIVEENDEPEDLSEPKEQRRMTLIHAAVWPANKPEEFVPPSPASSPLSRGTPLRVPSLRNPFDPNKS